MINALVTGASDGIGRETAAELARRGLHVLVHGRSEQRAKAASEALADTVPDAVLTPVWGDFSRMSEVVALARQVSACTGRLDVLVNNAGTYEKKRRLTDDGFEATMAVNHLAPYLLTRRLSGLMEAAAAARIVNVSSMTHAGAALDPDDLALTRHWSAYGAYAASKLANLLFTRALAERLPASMTVNALHPGVIGTKLLRAGFGMGGGKVEAGARTSVYLATAPEVAGISGRYFVDCKQKQPGREARNADLAERLWKASEQALDQFL